MDLALKGEQGVDDDGIGFIVNSFSLQPQNLIDNQGNDESMSTTQSEYGEASTEQEGSESYPVVIKIIRPAVVYGPACSVASTVESEADDPRDEDWTPSTASKKKKELHRQTVFKRPALKSKVGKPQRKDKQRALTTVDRLKQKLQQRPSHRIAKRPIQRVVPLRRQNTRQLNGNLEHMNSLLQTQISRNSDLEADLDLHKQCIEERKKETFEATESLDNARKEILEKDQALSVARDRIISLETANKKFQAGLNQVKLLDEKVKNDASVLVLRFQEMEQCYEEQEKIAKAAQDEVQQLKKQLMDEQQQHELEVERLRRRVIEQSELLEEKDRQSKTNHEHDEQLNETIGRSGKLLKESQWLGERKEEGDQNRYHSEPRNGRAANVTRLGSPSDVEILHRRLDHDDSAQFRYCSCGTRFRNENNLSLHLQTFNEAYTFVCEFEGCPKPYMTSEKWYSHMGRRHGLFF